MLDRVERSTYYLLLLVRILGLPNSLLQEVCIRQQVPHVLGAHEHNIQGLFIISQHVPAQVCLPMLHNKAASSRQFQHRHRGVSQHGHRGVRTAAATNSNNGGLKLCTCEEQSCWHSGYVAGSRVQMEIVICSLKLLWQSPVHQCPPACIHILTRSRHLERPADQHSIELEGGGTVKYCSPVIVVPSALRGFAA